MRLLVSIPDDEDVVISENNKRAIGDNKVPNWQNLCQSFDWITNNTHENAVALMNLWIVFATKGPLEIDAVGLQFLSEIENEFKKVYLDLFP